MSDYVPSVDMARAHGELMREATRAALEAAARTLADKITPDVVE